MGNNTYLRQLDIVKPSELDFPIGIIGAGGIGSWSAYALAKLGCRDITVIDFDKVEDKNTPSQLYNSSNIGEYKVEALSNFLKRETGVEIKAINSKFQDYYLTNQDFKLLICGVDSLSERKDIWAEIQKIFPIPFECYIDARMAGELIRILTVSPFSAYSMNGYAKGLNSKTPVHQEPCTARSVIYNTFICGGLVANIVKKYAKREEVKTNIIFDLKNVEIF